MLRKEENLNNPEQNQRYTGKSIEKGKRHNQVELVYLRFKFNLHLQSRFSWPNPTTVQWESLLNHPAMNVPMVRKTSVQMGKTKYIY